MVFMSRVDNNPVYFIEEEQKVTTASYYRSKNQALLNKATQNTWKRKKVLRIVIVAIIFLLAITCSALIHAFASSHTQLSEGVSNVSLKGTLAVERVTVDIEKGDTLWSIANHYAPSNVSISTYIHKIMKMNGLEKPVIQEGHLLLLP
jgi:LysM repeat protein